MKTLLALTLITATSMCYALTNQQIYTMETQTNMLGNSGDNSYQHTATQPSTGRDIPNSQTYQITTPSGQVVSTFQTNNIRAADSARQSFCNRSDSGFDSYETCMHSQATNNVTGKGYKATVYPTQKFKPVIYPAPAQ